MQNSVGAFNSSIFDMKHPYSENFVQTIKIVSFFLKFSTQPNSDILNSMVVFNFSILERKNSFRANLVQKIKIVSLS